MANTRFKTHHGLNATANSYIDGKLEVTGDLVVTGNVSFSGSSVGDFRPDADQRNLGNTSLRWNLVGFAANLASTLFANGATSLSNTLLVTGAATFQNTVTVTGVTNVAANVNVGGVTEISNNLIVSGTGTVNGTFTANGNTSFTNGILTVNTNSGTSANTLTIGAANVSVDSGTLFIDAINNRVGINNNAPGVALRVTGAADVSSTANIQGNANVGGTLGVVGITTLAANAVLSGALQTIAGNVNFDTGTFFVDATNNRVGVNNTAPEVAFEVTGAANVSISVNSALLTVGTGFIANSTAIIGTGYANVTTSVNSALLTVGTNFIANTTGAYHTGVINAASHTTTGFVANATAIVPTSNTILLGNSTGRFVLLANTGDFSTSVGVSTINSSSNGFFANSTTASLGNATDNVAITTSGITVSGADGVVPFSNTRGQVLGTTTKRWDLTANNGGFSGSVTISGNLTVSGTTTYINTTNLDVGDNIVTLNADLTGATAPTENAGLEINRGSAANVNFVWNETSDAWTLGNTNITGFANASVSVNSALLTVGTSFIANTTGAYHTGLVNAASITVGSNFIANSTAIVGTGYANITTSVNSALLTVGTSFIANTTGTYHTGVIDASSHTTSGFVANTTVIAPTSNTILLGNTIGRWVINANTGNFSGGVTFGTTINANGSTGTAGQVLISGGTSNAFWGSSNAFTSNVSISNVSPTIIFQDTDNITATTNSMFTQYNAGAFTFVQTSDATSVANTRFTFEMTTGTLTLDGEIRALGDVTAFYSDRRLKNISGRIPNALDKISRISGVYYTENDVAKSFGYNKGLNQVGVIAQEIEEVMPEAVKMAPFDIGPDGESKTGENYLTVQYDRLVPLLIEAIKELKQEIQELKNGN